MKLQPNMPKNRPADRSEQCEWYRDVLPKMRAAAGPEFRDVSTETWLWFYDREHGCKTHLIRLLCLLASELEKISLTAGAVACVKATRRVWKRSPERKKMQAWIKREREMAQHRARGGVSKAEWMAKVTKPKEYHAQKRRDKLRAKWMRLSKAPWYKKEPRGRDGRIPHSTMKVLKARRLEYIEWWRPIVKARLHEWKLEYWESMRRAGHRRLSNAIRKRLHKFVNKPILTPTCELIGCSVGELKAHLEKQFRPGWTWDNYGKKWNIDHITPLSKFDLSQPAHVKLASHYTNLRPMAVWANSLKQDRMIKAAAQPYLPLASPVLMAA